MGGNAVLGVGTIHITEVNQTLRKLETQLGFSQKSLNDKLLGSIGKKIYSGDIDVVMDPISSEELEKFFNLLKKLYGQKNVKKIGIMISASVPIEGYNENLQGRTPRTGRVQV